jgi:hypothetical protein
MRFSFHSAKKELKLLLTLPQISASEPSWSWSPMGIPQRIRATWTSSQKVSDTILVHMANNWRYLRRYCMQQFTFIESTNKHYKSSFLTAQGLLCLWPSNQTYTRARSFSVIQWKKTFIRSLRSFNISCYEGMDHMIYQTSWPIHLVYRSVIPVQF